jgi:uncharacterized protein YecE (DUF72 family)
MSGQVLATSAGHCRVGISGWTYPPWRGVFYPEELAHQRELEFASRQVNSIEINGSFYSLQTPASYRKWFAQTPDDFVFALKAPRFITHIKRLRDCEKPLANFFASGLLALRQKLGPILWQLPPSFKYDPERVAAFLRQLPHDTGQASRLARRHDSKVTGRSVLKTDDLRPIRHALEIRHVSFENEQFIELLREHQIALVVADTAGKWPLIEELTADFVYIRLHGDEELYRSGYTPAALDQWAGKIETWARGGSPAGARRLGAAAPPRPSGRDVYVYFDNDVKVHAPFDAAALSQRLGLPAPLLAAK